MLRIVFFILVGSLVRFLLRWVGENFSFIGDLRLDEFRRNTSDSCQPRDTPRWNGGRQTFLHDLEFGATETFRRVIAWSSRRVGWIVELVSVADAFAGR